MTDDDLYAAALDATSRAVPPYSGLHVGAVLEAADGTLFAGGNVESASYPVTICAERAALAAAVNAGHRRFRRIGVARADGLDISPCGMCRQALAEFGPMDVVYRWGGVIVARPLAELLPDVFLFDEEK